jgi:hypothetical protein
MKQQRTAMQELIHIMNNSVGLENGFEWRRVANLLLEKEKEQILNAFENGEVCTLFKNEDTSVKYYNETFKSE